MTLTNRGRRNPLIRRVRRHESLSTLFRRVDPGHAPVRPIVAPPILGRSIAVAPTQATPTVSQMAIEEAVQRVTAVAPSPRPIQSPLGQSQASYMPTDSSQPISGAVQPRQFDDTQAMPSVVHQPGVTSDVAARMSTPSPSIQQMATPAPLPPQPSPLMQQGPVQREVIQQGASQPEASTQPSSDGLDDATWSRLQAAYRKFKDRETGGTSLSTEAPLPANSEAQNVGGVPSTSPVLQRQPAPSAKPLRRTMISEGPAPTTPVQQPVHRSQLPRAIGQKEPIQPQIGDIPNDAFAAGQTGGSVQRTPQPSEPVVATTQDSESLLAVDSTRSDVAPSDVAPSDVAPSDVAPSDVAPSDVAPSDVAPSDVAPSDSTTSKLPPSDVVASDLIASDVAASDVVSVPVDTANDSGTNFTEHKQPSEPVPPQQEQLLTGTALPTEGTQTSAMPPVLQTDSQVLGASPHPTAQSVADPAAATPSIQLAKFDGAPPSVAADHASATKATVFRASLPQSGAVAANEQVDQNAVAQSAETSATSSPIQHATEPDPRVLSKEPTASDYPPQLPVIDSNQLSILSQNEEQDAHREGELSPVVSEPADASNERSLTLNSTDAGQPHSETQDMVPVTASSMTPWEHNSATGTIGQVEDPIQDTSTVSESALPLQDAWPVQRLSSSAEQTPSADNNVKPVQRKPSHPLEAVEPTTPMLNESVLNQLANVQTAHPTESSVHVMKPRRPRPRAKRAQGTADLESTNEGSLSDQQSVQHLQRSPDDIQPHVDNTGAAPNAADQQTLIPTEIGPLPADLWSMIDESPPITVQRTPLDVKRNTESRSSAQTMTQPPAVSSLSATDESNSAPHMEGISQSTTSAVIAKQKGVTTTRNGSVPLLTLAIAEDGEFTGNSLQREVEAAPVGETGEEATTAEGPKNANGEVDTEVLARLVYAELRRKLATERERLRPLQ